MRNIAVWEETLYLLRSPANAERLLESIAELNAGNFVQHDLIERLKTRVKPQLNVIVVWASRAWDEYVTAPSARARTSVSRSPNAVIITK